ncbi:nucleoside-diphosphate-sugar epimerase [Rhizomicrobium palustre]|uniref:Nucleoside-diphosphate-sugar epimerase n=1 Tax=Rhizomicrobium palustre TaxID=189966 RepID=A0A846N486_9PROT|nr:NAD-dependent epimerase/dehydratase family protein [Rhizomicrobium palustre]NIK89907.1 nucleoside-diphosphate-sugar epimerase [Rhizomicrobium palustre]
MAKALILGATGGIGGAMARVLRGRGFQVSALHRQKSGVEGGISWITGDAFNGLDVMRAAEGAEVIVHAVNPPQYRHWDKLVLPMIDNSIAAAKAAGARIVLPGTVYNYGPDAFPLLRETSPQNPKTRKGKIRVEMERHLQEGGAKVLIVRAGDFFGPGAGNNWFAQVIVKARMPVTRIVYPGARGVGHSWAYLPDLAETMMLLLERPLPDFARFHFQGHWDKDGSEMITAIRRVLGNPALQVSRFPWLATKLASPFVPMLRELQEMRYLWQKNVELDNTALMAALGGEPHTNWDEAVRATLAANGNLAS